MPTFMFLAIMWIAPPILMPISREFFFNILIIISLTSFFIPVLMLSTLRVASVIPDFYLDDRKIRIIPFLFIGIIYGVSTYMFYKQFPYTKVIYLSYFSTTLLITIITLITMYWKISVHSASIAGTFGILYAIQIKNPDFDFLYLLSGLSIIFGIVGTSRLLLNTHTTRQIIWGAVIGFVICFPIVWFFI